jgi:hypothetical protein
MHLYSWFLILKSAKKKEPTHAFSLQTKSSHVSISQRPFTSHVQQHRQHQFEVLTTTKVSGVPRPRLALLSLLLRAPQKSRLLNLYTSFLINLSLLLAYNHIHTGLFTMKDQCELIGPISIFFQFLLGLIIIASLVLKRQYEVPKRPMRVWVLDISKQIIGSLIIHFMNLGMSLKYKDLYDDGDPMVDYECNWYFINLFVDSTIGVLILYFYLVLIYRLIPHRVKTEESLLPQTNVTYTHHHHTHSVEEPFATSLTIFLTAIISMKITIYLFLLNFTSIVMKISDFLNYIGDSNMKVFIVMFLSPILLNLLQFLIVDNIIKLMRVRY